MMWGLALASILALGQAEQVAGGYRFTEGPAVRADGAVWFTDIPRSHICLYDPADGTATVDITDSGRANGLAIDPQGRLLACEGGRRRVVRYEPDGTIAVLADAYNGKRFNSPNDLVLDAHGGVYFTDPRYGRYRDDMEMNVEAVYYIAPGGEVTQLITDLKRPNGIGLSPDGGVLYVADEAGRKIMAYTVAAPGELAQPRVFIETPGQRGGCDGVAVDPDGRVYATLPDGVWVINAGGEKVAHIDTPGRPTNCALAQDTLYITVNRGLYRAAVPD